MKTKKIVAAALALSMLFSASCGKSSENDKSSSKAATSAASEEDELKVVQDLLDQYETAVKDKDYETLAKITNADMLQYISSGKESTEEEIIALLKGEGDENSDIASFVDTDLTEFEIDELECHNELVGELNDFLSDEAFSELCESEVNASEKYTIDGVYTYKLKSVSETGDDADVDFNSNFEMEMFVLRINDEWKVDCGYGLIYSMYKAFSNVDTNDFEGFDDEEDVEDAESEDEAESEEE